MGLLSSLKDAIFMDEDEDDDDELYEKEMKNIERKENSKKRESSYTPRKKASDYDDNYQDEYDAPASKNTREKKKQSTVEKFSSYSSSNITPPRSPESSYSSYRNPKPVKRTQDASDISIYKVKNFSDAQVVCDSLSSGRAIIVSFDEISEEESQRIMDFICGCIYVIEGNIHTISEKIYLFSPKDVDVSGDYMSMVQKNGFGVPTFSGSKTY
ncbi:MAG: cell division protein SepF [Lachnospiraceae bacterium]|nr:cell division protein SepF [Lachnospiraceae bacterium]